MFENEFFSGGLLLGALAYLATHAKTVAVGIYTWLKRRFTTSIVFENYSQSYDWIEAWLEKYRDQMQTNHSRIVYKPGGQSSTSNDSSTVTASTEKSKITKPSYEKALTQGIFTLRYHGKRLLIRLSRTRVELLTEGNPWVERIEISYWGTDQSVAIELIEEGRIESESKYPGETLVYVSLWGGWELHTHRKSRDLSTIIQHEDMDGLLLKDMKTFLGSRAQYDELGVNWKRGYLLDGPPGNGKSSSLFALAAELNMPLYLLLLSEVDGDARLMYMMSQLPKICILLIEDIDSYFNGRKVVSKSGKLTFSGFLNVFDGVASQEGKMIFLTTNHPDKLDPALMRHGRIDKQFHYPNASDSQIRRMFKRFRPNTNGEAEQFVEELSGEHSMASVQEMLWRGEK